LSSGIAKSVAQSTVMQFQTFNNVTLANSRQTFWRGFGNS